MFFKRTEYRSKRAEAKEYRRRMIASGLSALFALTVGLLVAYVTRLPSMTIETISVEGGTTVSHDAVRAKVESALSGTYALLIPRRFVYFYPEQDVLAAINSVPRAHSAEVVRVSQTELKVTFSEYLPYALWCESLSEDASSPSPCLFVDARGYAYAEAPPLVGETLVRLIVEGRAPEIGVFVHDSEYLKTLGNLTQALYENHGHRLRAITATKDGDLTLHLNGGVDVLMTKDTDISDAFATIESLLAAPEFKDIPLQDFDYIDLRFGNTVYVKERGAGETGATTTESN